MVKFQVKLLFKEAASVCIGGYIGRWYLMSFDVSRIELKIERIKIVSFVWQVAWLRVDTQTILTIATHVITKNHRIAVTHSGHRRWCLHIRDTKETDKGWYMCQVNTDPMSSNTGFLEVVGNQLFIYFFFNFQLPIINNFLSN